ncbi:hypothetical protein BRD00_01510 [Halobacteriales archaeon QS_8_69_26]|nr:MAG: hypothetical protein BRD00_01510 [Halobacteriales archaeon QS_8_69_26]
MTDDTDDRAVPTEDQASDPVLPDGGAGLDEDPRAHLDHYGIREGRWIHDHEQACYYYLYRLTAEEVVAVAAPNVIPGAGLDPNAWADPDRWSPMAIGDECVETHPAATPGELAEAHLDNRVRPVAEGVVFGSASVEGMMASIVGGVASFSVGKGTITFGNLGILGMGAVLVVAIGQHLRLR